MIYLTSDLHFGHKNIIKLTNRPFSDVHEMNETLIKNWNNTIKPQDTIYILGDLCFKMTLEESHKIIQRLNGKKILIRGNHDKQYDEGLFQDICDYKELKYNKQLFILSHYPFEEWNHFFSGAIHLHGHQHNHSDYNYKMKLKGFKRYDVGVDANMYRPVSIEDVMRFDSECNEKMAYNIGFKVDEKCDETQFDVVFQNELMGLFGVFCEENRFKDVKVLYIEKRGERNDRY